LTRAVLAKAAAVAGVSNINSALSIYSPAAIKAMINTANMTTLVTRLQKSDQAIQEALAGFADQAAKIQQMMDYSFQLARNPDYIGFANREKFKAAMKAKAIEPGLPVDAMSAIDAMEVEFVGSGLPTPPSQPDLNFDNFNQMHHLAQLKGPSSFRHLRLSLRFRWIRNHHLSGPSIRQAAGLHSSNYRGAGDCAPVCFFAVLNRFRAITISRPDSDSGKIICKIGVICG